MKGKVILCLLKFYRFNMIIFQKFTLKKTMVALTTDIDKYLNKIDVTQMSDQNKFLCESDITL